MTKETEGGKKASQRSLILQAQSLGDLLCREFNVPFVVYEEASGSVLAGQPEANSPPLPATESAEGVVQGDALVHYSPQVGFQFSLRYHLSHEVVFLALGRMPVSAALPSRSDATIRQQQRMLERWLSAVNDRLLLERQLRNERRAERAQTAQSSTTWNALLSLNSLARRLRVQKDAVSNQEQILKTAYGFAASQALYWIPARVEACVLVQGENLLSETEARQLGHALGKSPQLKAPAPLFLNRVPTTKWGWRFPQMETLIAFQVTDLGPVGWFIAINKQGGRLYRRSDAALLLPFVALLELHLRWWQRNKDLKHLLVGLTQSLANALDAKDANTYGHSERVARVAVELGKELGLQGEELGQIYLAGLLHDVGKIGVKDTILQKRGALTPEEQEHVRQHVMIGYWILAELRPIRHLLPGVLHHHERYDGTGYPAGLARETIPLLARILAVADAYDAMSHQRPYRESLPYHRVEETLVDGAGKQWDSSVVDAFLRCKRRIQAISQRPISNALRQAIENTLAANNSTPLLGPHSKKPRSGVATKPRGDTEHPLA
jgi:HD-GYP domain-containing protein (c-di-GMP phosphodiesterase class II)